MVLLQGFWAWVGSTGGAVANLLQILGTAAAAGIAAYGLLRRRLRHSGAIIARLRDDLEKRTEQLDRSLQNEKQLEANYVEVTSRLAETALADVRNYWRDDNYNHGHRTLIEWVDREGENISKLLLYRVEWTTAHAAGDVRPWGLVAAESYATAAISLWPGNHDAERLLSEIKILRTEEAQLSPPATEALAQLEERVLEMFEPDLVETADAVESEARRRFFRGHYHTALPLVEWAVILRSRTVGKAAVQTFRTQRLKAYILDRLGHTDKALPIARAVADAEEASPALGPEHPSTLSSRYLVAQLLNTLSHVHVQKS